MSGHVQPQAECIIFWIKKVVLPPEFPDEVGTRITVRGEVPEMAR
jgi:hypothetical protein